MSVAEGDPAQSGVASRVTGWAGWSPWQRVVLVLGVVFIVSTAAVVAVAVWPRESTTGPVSVVSSETPTSPSPLPTSPSPLPTASAAADLSAAELAERFGSAVWRVEAEGCGYVGAGTAFAVGPRTLITNAHVVANDANPMVFSRDEDVSVRAVVAGADVEVDVAVLVADRDLPGEELSWVGTGELVEGQRLVGMGYPVPDESFTVTPATVMGFHSDDSTRQALRLDGRLDRGNSGGPVLTSRGEVAGVVTSMLDGHFQWVPLAHTYEYLADAIRVIEQGQPGLVVDCEIAPNPPTVPDGWDVDNGPEQGVSGPYDYGDDPDLDRLYEACRDGDMAACDDLYWQSPLSSEYERFASTCGDIRDEPTWGACSWDDDESFDQDYAETFGDDPYLDELWTACAEGDMVACDDLYFGSSIGSDYEHFGATCGETGSGDGSCEWLYEDEETVEDAPWEHTADAMEYGDNTYLDELWDGCADGDLDACDTLYYDSAVGSDYEQFGATCGGHLEDPWAGHCYESTVDDE